MSEQWHAPQVVVHDRVYYPHQLPGFVAFLGGERVGLLTYALENQAMEVVTLNSAREKRGVGTALIDSAEAFARRAGCRRIWLITTNDNLDALGFYQKRGYHLVKVSPGAVDRARRMKAVIPLVGEHGIPIHDELELEKILESA
jgi:DNA-3-methyladenine glycosylase I